MGYSFDIVDTDDECKPLCPGGVSSIGYATLTPLKDALPGGLFGLDGMAPADVVDKLVHAMPALVAAHRNLDDFTSIRYATEILISCLEAGDGARFHVN